MSAPILVITGTDTGVGKTVVSAGLAKALVNQGVAAVAIKPVESGIDELEPGEAFGDKVKKQNSLQFTYTGPLITGRFSVDQRQPLPVERKLSGIRTRAREEDPFGKELSAAEAPDVYVIVVGWQERDDA